MCGGQVGLCAIHVGKAETRYAFSGSEKLLADFWADVDALETAKMKTVTLDVKAVHGDVDALLDAGLLNRTVKSHVVFPFAAIRVEFTLRAA